ncbi:Mitogen-activated protein kinase kinase kinase kinase 5 isoform 3 [Schistosoma japonicum]|uniref:Mitogen-activated protein kinase kinase kinase kinase n=1 Tax=Schistosoma japonicum TaxID=6182 RepID=A0A4Z2CWY5_SCHJA|nr:Mitogen-activated protein kinase kinase kinase kinase 5 isoform 3 [Schistosoma japonicum]
MSHPKLDYLRQFVKPNDPKEEYKILSPIGSGTYGDVFKAVHRERRTLVAVKVMKIDLKDDIRSICQEIHTLRECRHPNIVQFYGSYLRNNKLWICMEYCGGQSMQDIYLYTRRPLEEDCIAFVSRETLQGLNFMHNRGRIHRDIKGANILLTDDGHVKVADFGVAAQLSTSIAKRTTLIGTPYWMAPEVASIECRGSGYDGKCDIWGVGITAIEYAELQPPMFDLDPRKALQILGSRNYKPPSLQDRHKWSPLFHSFVKCCLIKAERRRPDAATMLTHNFITNPHLSTLLTQRLLCYRRQLESSAKNAYSHGDAGISLSNKRNPLPGGNFISQNSHAHVVSNMVMSNSGQQDEFNKSPSVNNDLSVSCGVGASGALHFVSSQQFVFERKPELFPNVQIQNSLSCSDLADDRTKNCNEIAESTDVNYISQGREVIINNNNVTKKDYALPTTVTSNGFLNYSQSNLSQSDNPQQSLVRPLLPAKSPKHSSLLRNDSNHSVDSTNSFNVDNNAATVISVGSTDNNNNVNKTSAITTTITNNNDKQKPSRPCPPIIRINPSRMSNINCVGELSEETGCLTENHLFADRLLHVSSEDLLREVMDAFDQRRSGVDFHASQSVDDLDINQTDDIKLNIQSQNDLSITRPTPPAPRSRSKRRAPPPPPLQSSAAFNITTATVTTNESNTMYSSFDQIINLSSLDIGSDVSKTNNLLINGLSAPSHENHVEETSNDITLNYNIKIIREDFVNNNNNEDEKYSNSVSINHNGQSPSNDNDKTLTPAPPRPPPPKFDNSHTVASLPTPLRKNKQNDDLKHISRQHQLEMGIGLPPTPKVHMGACFMQIFEGCPLKVNSTATWVNPETLSQIILFGTNDGIYYLDLVNLADGTLELLVPRRCLWLFVFKDTMMSISGRHPQLFSHNLISLMKSRTSQTRFLHKRFQPTVKVPDTRGCCIASVVRNQFKGMKYLCGTIAKSIFVMEWYNPRNTFIEVKRVEVPCMPNPVLNFDLIINPNQNLPTVCLGVSSTSDPLVYKLHLVNLNEDSSSSWYTNPCRLEDQLQVIKVVQLDTRSLLICFPTHATMVNMNGRVLVSRDGRIAKFPFDTTVDSIVRLPDSVLAFHTHGLRGIDFFGRITQDIDDDKHVYRLLGSDRNIVVESRPSDDPMSNSNLLILVGHEDSS